MGGPLFGASLLSAAASLPLHLLPLLLVSVASTPGQTAVQAAQLASACLLGQMGVALTLPALGCTRLRWRHALLAAAALVAVLAISGALPVQRLWVAWLAVGGACGALQFLGATTAAAAGRPPAAFALRLAVTLLICGVAVLGLQGAGGFLDYGRVAVALSIVFAGLTGLGLWFYRAPVGPPRAAEKSSRAPADVRTWLGLAVVFLLFVGQPGFWAFAIDSLQHRGVVIEELAYAIGFCKIAAGLVLLCVGLSRRAPAAQPALFWPGLGVALGVAGMAMAPDAALFLLALLLWELGLNVLSARLQAAVVAAHPACAGAWLTAAVLLGAAAGPLLHGLAIQQGFAQAFVAYACLSALLPVAWASGRGQVGNVALRARVGRQLGQ